MGIVFSNKGHCRFRFKDAAGEWRTVTSKARTKAEVRSELHERELEVERQKRRRPGPLRRDPGLVTGGV